jgi:5-methylcytosine-specific restriction endonuclease McrA
MPWGPVKWGEYLAKKRQKLLIMMGGVCAACGEDDLALLEIDHIEDRQYEPRQLSRTKRLKMYEEEYRQGRVRLLCSSCNKSNEYRKHNGGGYKGMGKKQW